METRDSRRQIMLEQMANHILEVGLQGASLRPLAAAAGTSDRMLLYYFADKNELLTATLGLLAEQLLELLDGSLSSAEPFSKLLPRVCKLMLSPAIKPYMKIWLELVAFAARGEEPFQSIAGQLCDGFLAWIAARLEVEREEERVPMAALLLATVEGLVLLNALGRGKTAEVALKGASLRNKLK